MPDDDLPSGEDPGTDPAELERVMKLATKDDALHGPFFRMLMAARVWILVPPPGPAYRNRMVSEEAAAQPGVARRAAA